MVSEHVYNNCADTMSKIHGRSLSGRSQYIDRFRRKFQDDEENAYISCLYDGAAFNDRVFRQ